MSIPFLATHTADDGRYYMVDECEWFYSNHLGIWRRHWSGAPAGLKAIRPKQPQAWSGPEDGLPPVGTVCECTVKADQNWVKCEIVAHHGRYAIGYVDENTVMLSAGIRFRSPEAIERKAAEQRESAIRELMDIAQVDCRVTAARLVDAGFKREGV